MTKAPPEGNSTVVSARRTETAGMMMEARLAKGSETAPEAP